MPYPQLNYGIDAPMGEYDAYALGNIWQPPIMMADAGMRGGGGLSTAQAAPATPQLGWKALIPGYAEARARQAQPWPFGDVSQQNINAILQMIGLSQSDMPLTQRIAMLGGGKKEDTDFLSGLVKGLFKGSGGGAMGGGYSMGNGGAMGGGMGL